MHPPRVMLRRYASLMFLLLLVISLLFVVSCKKEESTIDNPYTQRIVISKDQMQEAIFDRVRAFRSMDFVEANGRIYLDLGDIHEAQIQDYHDSVILKHYFSYNPNDDFYGIKYDKKGVYGGRFEERTIMYFPETTTLIRAREKAQIAFNETWTCMTYEDILLWEETGKVETDCYSYVPNPRK